MSNKISIIAMLGLSAFAVAVLGSFNAVFADTEVSVGGNVNTDEVDVPDARVCSTTLGCEQVNTPDVEEQNIEEEVTVTIGNLDE